MTNESASVFVLPITFDKSRVITLDDTAFPVILFQDSVESCLKDLLLAIPSEMAS